MCENKKVIQNEKNIINVSLLFFGVAGLCVIFIFLNKALNTQVSDIEVISKQVKVQKRCGGIPVLGSKSSCYDEKIYIVKTNKGFFGSTEDAFNKLKINEFYHVEVSADHRHRRVISAVSFKQ